jgi:hypothetical protein
VRPSRFKPAFAPEQTSAEANQGDDYENIHTVFLLFAAFVACPRRGGPGRGLVALRSVTGKVKFTRVGKFARTCMLGVAVETEKVPQARFKRARSAFRRPTERPFVIQRAFVCSNIHIFPLRFIRLFLRDSSIRIARRSWAAQRSCRGGDVDCELEAGNNETSLLAIASTAITFKDNSSKGFRSRDMITSVFASIHN